MHRLQLATALFAVLSASTVMVARAAPADEAPGPLDEAKTGIAIGEKAPPFALVDQRGEVVELTKLLDNGPVAVVFSRSYGW